MDHIRLYMKLLRMAVLAKMQYKADFLVGIASVFVLNAVNISMLGILVYQFHTLNGWSIWELLFLYSFWMISRGLYGVFFWHLHSFEEIIVRGDYDIFRIRPMSLLVQLFGREINYSGVGDSLVGILGFILAINRLSLYWGFGDWVYMLICILSGALIQMAINWIGASLCFWTTRTGGAMGIVERFTVLMQQYPVDIFGKWFQAFVTCILPVAFINYYPSVVLLKKGQHSNGLLASLSPVVAILLLIISYVIWLKGNRRYSSTGT